MHEQQWYQHRDEAEDGRQLSKHTLEGGVTVFANDAVCRLRDAVI